MNFIKHIDFSVFKYGTAIPVEFHKIVDEFIGHKLKRGEIFETQILLLDKKYDCFLTIPANKSKTDQYQLRYKDSSIVNQLKKIFRKSYEFIIEQKNFNIAQGMERPAQQTIFNDSLKIFFDKVNNCINFEAEIEKSENVRNLWSQEELILCLKLYFEIPFGKMHNKNPKIIKLANYIGRTPSAVGWKLCNFASLDPELKKRNIKGAKNCSKLDKKIFEKYYNKFDEILNILENHHKDFLEDESDKIFYTDKDGKVVERIVKTRLNQSFFRNMILNNYNHKCCITNISVPELLIASHIVPWSIDQKNRLNPKNGLCLNNLHDKVFDNGFITITPDFKIKTSDALKENFEDTYNNFFRVFEGNKIILPERYKPNKEFLEYHNKEIFLNKV